MFGFGKKQKKLVKRWENEHQKIVELAGEVINAYTVHDTKRCKATLTKLSGLASNHIMNEDLEFFKLNRDNEFDPKTLAEVEEFKETFRKTKLVLMSFLTKYSASDTPLDEDFFNSFNELVGVLAKRIEFEENNLYQLMLK